ncbi:MAG TPA: hypothetical protein VGF21_03415 [Thermoleophilaceae bacterium]
MAVAFLALFFVLSGSAVALKGHNKVLSDDIKNGQVKTADIKNNDVRGKDVRNNTLSGSDIAESKLGKVPSAGAADTATNANRAVAAGHADQADNATSATNAANAATADDAAALDGQSMTSYSFDLAAGESDSTTFGDVVISVDCVAGVANTDAANATTDAAILQGSYIDTDATPTHVISDTDFTSGDADDIGENGSGAGTASVSFDDGSVTSIEFAFQQSGGGCHYSGRIISDR